MLSDAEFTAFIQFVCESARNTLLQARSQQEANQVGPLMVEREALEAQVEQLREELVRRDEAQVRTLLHHSVFLLVVCKQCANA